MASITYQSLEPAMADTHGAPTTVFDRQITAWLRLEGVAALGLGAVLYGMGGGEWLFVIPLLLLPDLALFGYVGGPVIGAFTYNVVHNWTIGFIVAAAGLWLGWAGLIVAGAVLIAHVGMDRALGYGMKLPTSFHDTHLGRIGREGRGSR